MYWQVEYDTEWLPICEICGKSFRKLCSHVYNTHNIRSIEYKIMNWLDIKKWICCQTTRQSLQRHIKKNYELVVVQNLLEKWKHTRFDWSNKYKKKYVSEQTKVRLRKHIQDLISKRKNI